MPGAWMIDFRFGDLKASDDDFAILQQFKVEMIKEIMLYKYDPV